MTDTTCIFIQPMGGWMTDPVGGEREIMDEARRLGVRVPDAIPWRQTPEAANLIRSRPVSEPISVIGVSCGANRLGDIAAMVAPRKIAVMVAVQASKWCRYADTPIPPNVINFICVWAPCWKTAGFGCHKPPLSPGNKTTNYEEIATMDLHPGDFDHKGVHEPILNALRAIRDHGAIVLPPIKPTLGRRLYKLVPAQWPEPPPSGQ